MTVPIDEILRLEHQGWESPCQSTGADFYGQLMTEGAVMSSAYAWRDRRWRLTLYQQTTVPGEPA